MAVWDHIRVYERTVYPMHRALTNNICFFDSSSALSCASASSDGLLKVVPSTITLDFMSSHVFSFRFNARSCTLCTMAHYNVCFLFSPAATLCVLSLDDLLNIFGERHPVFPQTSEALPGMYASCLLQRQSVVSLQQLI